MRIHPITIIGLLVVTASIAAANAGEAADAIAFQTDRAGSLIVPVRLGGAGPFFFLLDTGSSGSAVAASLARRLSLPTTGQVEVVTPAGEALRDLVASGPVTLGDRQVDGVRLTVLADGALQRPGTRVDGILGQDVLSTFDYTLDYENQVVWVNAPRPADDERGGHDVRLALIEDHGRYVVDLPQGRNGETLRFVPDSGTTGLVIFDRPGRRLPPVLPMQGRLATRSAVGAGDARPMLLLRLRVGDLTITKHPIALIERPATDVPQVDGLLPLHLFKQVTFRSREKYLVLR